MAPSTGDDSPRPIIVIAPSSRPPRNPSALLSEESSASTSPRSDWSSPQALPKKAARSSGASSSAASTNSVTRFHFSGVILYDVSGRVNRRSMIETGLGYASPRDKSIDRPAWGARSEGSPPRPVIRFGAAQRTIASVDRVSLLFVPLFEVRVSPFPELLRSENSKLKTFSNYGKVYSFRNISAGWVSNDGDK